VRILILGKDGQVGWELLRALAPLGEVIACGREACELSDPAGLRRLVTESGPQIIVNAAAYNAVDRAESETDLASAINARAPEVLAESARALGVALIHYSSDYVFNGDKSAPYTEADPPAPINFYGQSKLAGEEAIRSIGGSYLIFRTSWVFSTRRGSFVTKVLQWSRRFPELRIVNDQIGSPSWARMLAEATGHVLAQGRDHPVAWIAERAGLYHLGGTGEASRFDWARAILKYDPRPEEQVARAVLPARSVDFPTPALRPSYSALACQHFTDSFGLRLPDWESSLRLAMEAG